MKKGYIERSPFYVYYYSMIPSEYRAGKSFQDDSCHLTLVIYIVSSLWNTILNVVVAFTGAVCHTSLNWLSCVQFQNRHPESR